MMLRCIGNIDYPRMVELGDAQSHGDIGWRSVREGWRVSTSQIDQDKGATVNFNSTLQASLQSSGSSGLEGKKMRFGAHVSIAGGMSSALERAKDLQINVLQIFSRSPRGRGRDLSEKEIENFRQRYKELSFHNFYLHSPYYVNLASPDPRVWHSSISCVVEDLKLTGLLEARYLVVHTGNHRGNGVEQGIKRVVRALKEILGRTFSATLLLENTAGQGTAIGCRWEEIASIIHSSGVEERLGTCMDTCHAFASGYDVRTKEKVDETLERFDRIVGLNRLRLLHGNDSKGALGSRIDRHENIGRGRIGLGGFRALVNHPTLEHLDMIIETPKMGSKSDRRNLDILTGLVGQTASA